MGQARRRRSITDAFLLELLTGQLDEWRRRTGRAECRVVDLGGGTGTFASALADLGHTITVVDPSPDALASLRRRSADRGREAEGPTVPAIRGVQGDASELVSLLGPRSVDLVVCHRVLEMVEDPGGALRGMAEVLTPGGALSLVLNQSRSVVLAQALSGHAATALRTWQDPARTDLQQVLGQVGEAGFRVLATDGIGSIAHYVAESMVETDAAFYADLLALERGVSQDPAFRALAPAAHVFAELTSD